MGKITFANQIDPEKLKEKEKPPPKAMPRSNSTTGLSSLSRSVIEAEHKQCILEETIQNVQGIIKQYEAEILKLKESSTRQLEIITSQEKCLGEYENELKKAKHEIEKLCEEINTIWTT